MMIKMMMVETVTTARIVFRASSKQPTQSLILLTVYSMESAMTVVMTVIAMIVIVMTVIVMTIAATELDSTKANTVHYFGRDKSLVLL